MPDRDWMLHVAHAALEVSQADQTEVLVSVHREGLTRFANNVIHQNVAESSVSISMRAVIGKRIGVAATNDPSVQSVRDLAQRATELARLAAPSDDFVSLPGPSELSARCQVDPALATVEFGPEERGAAVKEIITLARGSGLRAAGQVMTGRTAYAVTNSLGIEAQWEQSHARARVVMQGSDSSGFAEAEAADVRAIPFETLARTAVDKAVRSAEPVDLAPGRYTVILEPLAVSDMLTMLAVYDLHALAHQEGRSFTSGRMGEKVCGDNVSIWDDGCDPRGMPLPYDFEGVPRQRVELIRDGVLVGVTYDSFTAGREPGARNTGHALPAPNTWGPIPQNLFMKAGDYSLEEMIRATERGVLVTRFHYTNMVHPVRTVFTGMTRDGTFLIEGGQVVRGLKNLRFTQSILEALSNVDMIGKEGAFSEIAWAPPLRIQDFTFSSATLF